MNNLIKFFKKEQLNLLLFSLLVVTTAILQNALLSKQLEYGFRDGDWMILFRYKDLGDLSLNHLINAWKLHGVYTYQIYYIGFSEALFGLNFEALHLVSHFFKLLASLSLFPLILIITNNRFTAFFTIIIYSIAFPTVGALFMFLTGAYFIAIIFMNIFFTLYFLILKNHWTNFKWDILLVFLFLLTLILNTERMYPIIPIVLIIELFWIFYKKNESSEVRSSIKRIVFLFTPFFIFFIYYFVLYRISSGFYFTPFQVFPGTQVRIESILHGNWQLVLSPFASFGSLFIPDAYWKYFGNVNVVSLSSFTKYFIGGPVLMFSLITTAFALIVSEKPKTLIFRTILCFISLGFFAFLLSRNWRFIDTSSRIHFDPSAILPPTLVGFYVISLSLAIFWEWMRSRDKFYIPILLGTMFSSVFILFTWIPSDIMLTFVGPQRYLVIPAIGSSLIQAGIIAILVKKMIKRPTLRNFAWAPLLLIFPIILINAVGAQNFFNYELNFAGMRGTEQTIMKDKLWKLVPNISSTEPSFFYFDESQAGQEGYFGESTILAGFDFWIKFKGSNIIKGMPDPGFMRSNVSCPKPTPQSCIELLKQYLTAEKDGFLVNAKFYKLENFYAIQFIGRDMIDIKQEVLSRLQLR